MTTFSSRRDEQHRALYASAIGEAAAQGEAAFQNWFNQADSVEQATVRGYWDFALHMLTPSVCARIRDPEKMTALEIGYGGGRLLHAACGFFGHAIGVDIHRQRGEVERYLSSQGRRNFTLIEGDGRSLLVPDASIDFVYSFIVLQHLPGFDVFVSYLRECFRVLRHGGADQLYFGTWRKLSWRERIILFCRGYKEIPEAPVNYTSLVVRVGKAKSVAREIGFRVVDSGHSYKRVPDGYGATVGGQDYITVIKE